MGTPVRPGNPPDRPKPGRKPSGRAERRFRRILLVPRPRRREPPVEVDITAVHEEPLPRRVRGALRQEEQHRVRHLLRRRHAAAERDLRLDRRPRRLRIAVRGQPARVHRREDLRRDHRVHPHPVGREVHRPFPREAKLPRLRRHVSRRPALPRQRRLGGDVHDRPPRRDQRVAAEMHHRVVVHEVAVERGAERRRARVEPDPVIGPRTVHEPVDPPLALQHASDRRGAGRLVSQVHLQPGLTREAVDHHGPRAFGRELLPPPPRRCPTRRRSRSRPCPEVPDPSPVSP